MTTNRPFPQNVEINELTTRGRAVLSAKLDTGFKVTAIFDTKGGAPKVERVTVAFPPSESPKDLLPKSTTICLTGSEGEFSGIQRVQDAGLEIEEFKAVNEAVKLFGGKAHKWGDALREVLGKTSGGQFTILDNPSLKELPTLDEKFLGHINL